MHNLKYRPEIDGLRAIAVLAVILFHSNISFFNYFNFNGGFVGVDIFFVISGYLITRIILVEYQSNKSFSFIYFYERRIRRILPPLLFVIFLSFPFGVFILIPDQLVEFSKSILYSITFISNFFFYFLKTNYWITDTLYKPYLHTWSLSIEEQFYIIFPLLFILLLKYFNKDFFILILITMLFSFQLLVWGDDRLSTLNFYMVHTRMWEFLAGSILATLEVKHKISNRNKLLKQTLSILGFLFIIFSIFFYDNSLNNQSIYVIHSVIGTCLIIWFGQNGGIITKILSNKLLVAVGLISYSLYLFHFPIFSFYRNYTLINDDFYFNKYVIIIILFSLSSISYFFIEKPSRDKNLRFDKLIKFIVPAIFLIIIINLFIIFKKGEIFESHEILKQNIHIIDHEEFEKNYNYDNFDNRKNIFLVGDSYSEDLLNIFFYNKKLQDKFYFYTASPSKGLNNDEYNYSIECFVEFLKNRSTVCNNFPLTTHLFKQYKESHFLILHQRSNEIYLNHILEISKLLKEDKKKFIVFINDVDGNFGGAFSDLDRYVYKYKKLPQGNDLKFLKNKFFNESMLYDKENIEKIINILKKNNISYITRKDIYCNHILKECELLTTENKKIYYDSQHLTKKGAEFFSSNISILLNSYYD